MVIISWATGKKNQLIIQFNWDLCKVLRSQSQFYCVYICPFFPVTSLMMIMFVRNMYLICVLIFFVCVLNASSII